MPTWTPEQQLAITKSNTNIIVSAGAGSGKTAVLTERVIRKLQNGEDIDRLLILTFTNAAAKEMKERIRKAIKKNNLLDQLDKIDSSYITTFDSFSLSIVKKYHYLLNISKDVEIADSLILKWEKQAILDKIFDNYYINQDESFLNLIQSFTTRDDDKLKANILTIYDKLDLMYDKEIYLNDYLDNYFNLDYIENSILEYENIILKKINRIKEDLDNISLIADGNYYYELLDSLASLINSKTYDEFKKNIDIKLPRLKKSLDDVKPYKESISNLIKEIKKLLVYEDKEEIKTSILNTKEYVKVIISIIKKLDLEFNKFKNDNNLYDFLDIAKIAIKIVLEHEDVKLELKNYFSEILVDEYQDTSDIQELFISLISNNNLYMVGDIKQSIYRFRNANPNLFKEKYDKYEKGIDGFKIDLVKNFRSREETLDNINYVFNYIMDLEIGGADYKKSHQMVFGNTTYNEFKLKEQDNNFEILNYSYLEKEFKKDEIEAFIVSQDIINKVENKYQVFDKDEGVLRDIKYSDFSILIDKSTSFSLYKKIFEYKNIPLTILKDESISISYDLFILKNILNLLKKIKENDYNQEFLYAYYSISRSYLFNLSDDYIFNTIKNNTYKETILYNKLLNLYDYLDIIPVNMLIDKIILEFDFYNRLITVGNINDSIIRFDYLSNLAKNLSNLSYTYLDLIDYLKKMIEDNEEIKYSLNKDNKDSVKIMTIHKSKGLEYHICYYTGLTNKFNLMDAKKRFLFDNKYGIVIPSIKDNLLLNTIYHTLYKTEYIKEDISERIRLFYVALTRAKEKMILITSLDEEEESDDDLVSLDTRLKYNSFKSILNSINDKLIPYIKNINLSDYHLTKDYNIFKNDNIKEKIEKTNEKLMVEELNLRTKIIEKEHFSKTNYELITKEIKNKMEFGTYLHYLFEVIDFKNIDLDNIEFKYRKYIENFIKSDLLKNINEATIYKEYEFIYSDTSRHHGIIDLMLEYDDYIDIIDYKLKNISDLEYINQLNGYKNYIANKTSKKVNIYLYSIIDNKYQKIL